MGIEDLFCSIIQSAYTGKLTNKLDSDSSIVAYLKKNSITPSVISDDEYEYDVPEDWILLKLKDIASFSGGFAFKSSNYTSKGIRVIRISDFNETGLLNKDIKRYQYSSELEDYLIKENDILMCMTGGTVGKCCFISKVDETMAVNQRVAKISVNKLLNQKYIYYFMKSPYIIGKISEAKNSTNDNISMELIKNFCIPLPSVEEQERIVQKIEEAIPLFDNLQKHISDLRQLNEDFAPKFRKSILKYAMSGKLVPQNDSDEPIDGLLEEIHNKQLLLAKQKAIKIGKYSPEIDEDYPTLPKGWKYIKIGAISNLVTKQTGFDYSNVIKPSLLSYKAPNTVPLIQTRNFKGKSFLFDSAYYVPMGIVEQYPNLTLNKKCLLLSIVGASIGNVGYFDFDTIGFVGGAIAKIDLTDNVLFDYLYYFLQSPLGFAEIMKNYKANAQGTITVEDVRNIVVPFPPVNEQKRIITKLEEVLEELDSLTI